MDMKDRERSEEWLYLKFEDYVTGEKYEEYVPNRLDEWLSGLDDTPTRKEVKAAKAKFEEEKKELIAADLEEFFEKIRNATDKELEKMCNSWWN